MKIKNVKGSSKISPKAPSGYTSWRNYWESIFGQNLEAGKNISAQHVENGLLETISMVVMFRR